MADLRNVLWNEFPADAGPQDQVSPNFQFYELTRSGDAERQKIDNRFAGVAELHAAVHLCRNVLQPLRDRFGRFSPNSVYRSQTLERFLKKQPQTWVSESQHTLGQACDVEIPGMPTLELARWVSENLKFDQVICECYDPAKGPNAGWVHVSLRPPGGAPNRGDVRSYVLDQDGKEYVYVKGLHAVA